MAPRYRHRNQKQQESLASLETHYFSHNAWLTAGELLGAAKRIPTSVPLYIVQGRYDLVCPPAAALKLAAAVPHSKIRLTVAGHAWDEVETERGLKEALQNLAYY